MTSEQHGIYPRGFSSSIDWPWPLVPAKELVTLNYGKALRENDRTPGRVPVYGTNGRCGWHDSSLTKGPGVILGRKGQGPLGVEWCETDFWVIDTAYFATANHPEMDLRYFYYLVNYIGLNHLKVGTSNPSLSRDTFDLQLLPFPPLEIQKRIVKILATLDRKIENLRRQNETLEAIAQTLFKHWFVDFEFPNADGKPYKSSGGEMVPSELGDIPAGWRIGKLRDITEVINGRAYKQTEFKEEGTPIVRIQNLTGKGQTVYSDLDLDEDKYISKGDLIYAWSATFGPYIWRGVKSIYHYHIWKLNCFNPAFKYYLYIHLKKVSNRVKNQGTGSIFTHITKQLMESQELFVPNDDVMERWHGLAKSLFDKIMSNHEQIETLTNTRDVLLPKLMSGKLRIQEGLHE